MEVTKCLKPLDSGHDLARGVDGQDFPEVEAYGVERWLGELALALRKEAYRPDPSEECPFRSPTANSGCQATQPCEIRST
jgi:hypothetical protein